MATNQDKQKGVKVISLSKLIPNMLTVIALCAGLSAIRFSIAEKWEWVVLAVLVAAIFDALDGAMARLLKAESKIGAELDSLSDFLAFGIAPALIVYLWLTHSAAGFGWFAAMAFSVATALRLARFNTESKDETKKEKKSMFFCGVPSPAGALLALMPVVVNNYFYEISFKDYPVIAVIVSLWVLFIAALMVSNIPTYSIKTLKVPHKAAMPLLAALGLFVAALVTELWLTLMVVGVLYLASLPFSIRSHRKFFKQDQ